MIQVRPGAAERRRDGRLAGKHERADVRYSLALAHTLQRCLSAGAATIDKYVVRQQQNA